MQIDPSHHHHLRDGDYGLGYHEPMSYAAWFKLGKGSPRNSVPSALTIRVYPLQTDRILIYVGLPS